MACSIFITGFIVAACLCKGIAVDTPAYLTAPRSGDCFQNVSLRKSAGGKALCVAGDIYVNVSATNQRYSLQTPGNQFAATEVIQEYAQNNSTLLSSISLGTQAVSGVYRLSAELCYPADMKQASSVTTVQLLTHGITYTKAYWDPAPGYSYVDAAAEAGYATLAYDRLGSGQSDHPDGVQVVQSAIQAEIIHALVRLLTNGDIGPQSFGNVVCVGHSYGSILQSLHDANYPEDCAAAILTGVSLSTPEAMTAVLLGLDLAIANAVNASAFGKLTNDYLTEPNEIAIAETFYRSPFFDTEVFQTSFNARSTVAFGEVFSLASGVAQAPNYTKPIDVVDGQFDLPFCFGDCGTPVNFPDAYRSANYPQASNSATYIVPNTGHVINTHFNAALAYQQMLDFLSHNGL